MFRGMRLPRKKALYTKNPERGEQTKQTEKTVAVRFPFWKGLSLAVPPLKVMGREHDLHIFPRTPRNNQRVSFLPGKRQPLSARLRELSNRLPPPPPSLHPCQERRVSQKQHPPKRARLLPRSCGGRGGRNMFVPEPLRRWVGQPDGGNDAATKRPRRSSP
ncbi:Hypothetical predicted protein [Podarcis lilfordi]|uniref:Uncharacterized protein n=1 Tax=Podarcis lilfordi TaxID=74358 RepID=A0AA35KKI5_9SAUR|nr:Hypothetical predicted protein [Podarcis lilfordi]